MDDGSYLKDRGIVLSTPSFTYEEVLFLSKLLEQKFNLKTTIQKGGLIENRFQIYILKESLPHLISLIKPFIIPSMYYKFGITG